MSHTCSTALVRCMDFRLGNAIKDYLESNNLYDDVDIISLAGAAKDLNDPEGGVLETQLSLSKRLHSINTVILMNHTDCGGYGGRAAFESAEAEHKHHVDELGKAKEKLLAKYPDLTVKTVLADIKEDGIVSIDEI
ncbi:MAG: carbonic anhydrase [bacterium]